MSRPIFAPVYTTRTNISAIRERNQCRPIPWLHRTSGPLIIVTFLLQHCAIILPRLRNHSHHSLGQRSVAGHCQKFQYTIGRSRIGQARFDNRKQSLQIVAENITFHHTLTSLHRIDITAKRINFTVMGQHTQRMRPFPGRKRVRTEARMNQCQIGRKIGVQQIRVIVPQLIGCKKAFVDNCLN